MIEIVNGTVLLDVVDSMYKCGGRSGTKSLTVRAYKGVPFSINYDSHTGIMYLNFMNGDSVMYPVEDFGEYCKVMNQLILDNAELPLVGVVKGPVDMLDSDAIRDSDAISDSLELARRLGDEELAKMKSFRR